MTPNSGKVVDTDVKLNKICWQLNFTVRSADHPNLWKDRTVLQRMRKISHHCWHFHWRRAALSVCPCHRDGAGRTETNQASQTEPDSKLGWLNLRHKQLVHSRMIQQTRNHQQLPKSGASAPSTRETESVVKSVQHERKVLILTLCYTEHKANAFLNVKRALWQCISSSYNTQIQRYDKLVHKTFYWHILFTFTHAFDQRWQFDQVTDVCNIYE